MTGRWSEISYIMCSLGLWTGWIYGYRPKQATSPCPSHAPPECSSVQWLTFRWSLAGWGGFNTEQPGTRPPTGCWARRPNLRNDRGHFEKGTGYGSPLGNRSAVQSLASLQGPQERSHGLAASHLSTSPSSRTQRIECNMPNKGVFFEP